MKKLFASTAIALILAGGFAASTQAASSLTDIEAKTLQFMHEEEKLAKDVYLTLYDKWNIRSFSNIAEAEQRHQDQLKSLLDQYGVPSVIQSRNVVVVVRVKYKFFKSLFKQLPYIWTKLKIGMLGTKLNIPK